MSAKVVVIVEDEDARVRARSLAIEMRGGESADAASHDDEVVCLAGILRRASCVPEGAVAQRVRRIERSGMAAAQSGERGRVVGGRLLGIAVVCGEQMPRHQGSAGSHGHAVEEVTARDVAFHSQFAVVVVAHQVPEFSIFRLEHPSGSNRRPS